MLGIVTPQTIDREGDKLHAAVLAWSMDFELSAIEVRILGCLIEKEATTPDVYPLTMNSLLTACNQKSNREPVMHVDTDDLETALDNLIDKTLVSTWKSERNRAAKYQHKLSKRVFDEFNFPQPELAALAVLFLRGPQTTGEIRSRAARIHDFDRLEEVTEALSALENNPHGPYVRMLPRQEGRKESRYAHLFSGEPDDTVAATAITSHAAAGPAGGSRLDELQQEVDELRAELQDLKERFTAFSRQFE